MLLCSLFQDTNNAAIGQQQQQQQNVVRQQLNAAEQLQQQQINNQQPEQPQANAGHQQQQQQQIQPVVGLEGVRDAANPLIPDQQQQNSVSLQFLSDCCLFYCETFTYFVN